MIGNFVSRTYIQEVVFPTPPMIITVRIATVFTTFSTRGKQAIPNFYVGADCRGIVPIGGIFRVRKNGTYITGKNN